jgi:hypothetical protein
VSGWAACAEAFRELSRARLEYIEKAVGSPNERALHGAVESARRACEQRIADAVRAGVFESRDAAYRRLHEGVRQ